MNHALLSWNWIDVAGGGIARAIVPWGERFYPAAVVDPITTKTYHYSQDGNGKPLPLGAENGSVTVRYGYVVDGSQRYFGWLVTKHVFNGVCYDHVSKFSGQDMADTVCDRTPPAVSILSPAQGATLNKSSANLSFSADEQATFRCSWDSGPLRECSSPWGTTGLSDGAHSATVEATDVWGNVASRTVTFSVASTLPPPEAMLMLVRDNAGIAEVLHGGELFRLGPWSWNQGCMSGFQAVGDFANANGFRLCVRSDLADRRFFVGNVVNNGAGNFYQVKGGSVTYFGDRGWSHCPSGSQLLGQYVAPNGFWVCMAPADDPGPDAMLMLVRNNSGAGHLVYRGEDFAFGGWGWASGCMAGFQPVGDLASSNGFRLCARAGLVTRDFYMGNVVNNGAGNFYWVRRGYVTRLADRGWSSCPSGTQLIGQWVNPNGYWLCLGS